MDHLYGQDTYTLFTSEHSVIARIMKFAEENPEDVEFVAKNADGSILCRIPKKWIRIQPPRKISDEERAKLCQRLQVHRQPDTQPHSLL